MSELIPPRPQAQSGVVPGSTFTTVLVAVIVIAGLYLGREVLVPIALALLLSFVLAPLVRLLVVWHFPRGLAVVMVVGVAFAAISGLGALMLSQVKELASDLPGYQTTLQGKIHSLRGAAGGMGTLERASEVLQNLNKEIDGSNNPSAAALADANRDRPIPVEIRPPDPGALQTIGEFITPLIHPLATTGIVLVFVVFILLQRQDLRNRLVRLAGARGLQRTTAALDDAGQRLSRLFLTQLVVNAGFGVAIGIGLWIIGVPSAPLWGMLATIMRFVPYIGAVISAVFPLVLAAAVGSGWTMLLETAALFLTAESIVGQVIEPLLYGQSTGLSPVAVITAATFWTWLWGPIGLVLATPLTMCLVVVGRHVDRLKFFEVMFGDEPPLTPAELVYQRMLARDPVEAVEQAHAFLKERPLTAYFDEILLQGLKLAQVDAERGLLDQDRMQRIHDVVVEIVDDLGDHVDKVHSDKDEESPGALVRIESTKSVEAETSLSERWKGAGTVLCVPGSSLLDEAMALVVTRLVERQGIGARAESAGALSMGRVFSLETKGQMLICLCYLEYVSTAQIRYAIRRLRRKAPDVRVLLALFGNPEGFDSQEKFEDAELFQDLGGILERISAIARAEAKRVLPTPAAVAI